MRILFAGFLALSAACAAPAPEKINACVKTAGPNYEISHTVSPSYITGDFDGDGLMDIAVIVDTGSRRDIVVCRGAHQSVMVLGATAEFEERSSLDFASWRLHAKTHRVARVSNTKRPPVLSGDALVLEWEVGNAVVYWTGKRFTWYAQGD